LLSLFVENAPRRSKRIDGLGSSFDNHLFSKSAKAQQILDENMIGSSNTPPNEIKMLREELSFKCDGAFVKR
tara:strand:- start:170 stop:385 length:216 start_codon:yes stop_codon:yes gene_type:complete